MSANGEEERKLGRFLVERRHEVEALARRFSGMPIAYRFVKPNVLEQMQPGTYILVENPEEVRLVRAAWRHGPAGTYGDLASYSSERTTCIVGPVL